MKNAISGLHRYLAIALLLFIWVAAMVYWYGLASDRYVSEAKFVVQRSGGETAAGFSVSSLLGGVGSSATNDALMLREYIQSVDMYELLDEKLDLRVHYSDPRWDLLSRLAADALKEKYYRYMDDKITVVYDDVSAVLSLKATAYTPELARKVVEHIVHLSEAFINNVGYRLAREQVDFASLQLAESRKQLEKASNEVLEFQNDHGILSPEITSKSVTTIISRMEAELATARTILNSLTSYLSSNAQEVMTAKARVQALERQIRRENQKLVGIGENKDHKLNVLNAKFENLKLEAQFRADTYSSALTVFEAARIEATHKLKHLVVIESAALPEEAAYPRKIYNMATFMIISTLLFWIARLAVATVKDHRD